ncbi:Protein CUP-SHAPED COTYLEDON [Sarracenia purpurea var. burkii]
MYKEEWVICRIHHKIGEKKNPVFQGQNYPLEAACAWSPITGTLPPLLETASVSASATTAMLESQSHNQIQMRMQMQMQMQSLQNQNQNPSPLIHHYYQDNNDLKMLINPIGFPMNGFQLQTSFSPTPSTPTPNSTTIISSKNNLTAPIPSSPSILFNSHSQSHESLLLSHQQTTTIPKQCKTEPNFSSLFQLSDNANLRWEVDKIDHHEPYANNPLFSGMGFGGIGFPSAASDSFYDSS